MQLLGSGATVFVALPRDLAAVISEMDVTFKDVAAKELLGTVSVLQG